MTVPVNPPHDTTVGFELNGSPLRRTVLAATSLMDLLRDEGCTSVHSGCEHGVCGACTVLVDGEPARSCILLAVQADGCVVETVEGLGTPEAPSSLQLAFSRHGGLQCGFCTPAFIMLGTGLLRSNADPADEEILDVVSSNLCRCTGYTSICEAIRDAAGRTG
ncbi:(2Fe-2S)-binding protein [Actinomadura macra]|uniref:(2Fe-2S)-binding protein n=1 Tax=Actinomadura macra TaxID=46164 RepID=UPI000A5F538D|nr:(2Fe-2S)-binding protein [Actinomadura macra]